MPRSLETRGRRVEFEERKRARVQSARKGRPPAELIRAWCRKRKHVTHWRNRDSSYEAIVEFYGDSAFEQASRAMHRAPGRPYFNIVCYEQAQDIKEKDTAPERVIVAGEVVYLKPVKLQTQRGENPGDAYDTTEELIKFDNPLLYRRRVGLRLYWAQPVKGDKS